MGTKKLTAEERYNFILNVANLSTVILFIFLSFILNFSSNLLWPMVLAALFFANLIGRS